VLPVRSLSQVMNAPLYVVPAGIDASASKAARASPLCVVAVPLMLRKDA